MLRELSMIRVMDQLTDKPEWTRKVYDEVIVAKWKNEAMEAFKNKPPGERFSEKMWDYVSRLLDFAK